MALLTQLSWDWLGTNDRHLSDQKPKKKMRSELTENINLDATSEDISNGSITPVPSNLTEDPLMITLTDGEPPSKKPSMKASSMKDPESGLTMDTVKRRKLCARYDNMLSSIGVWHRIHELPNLTHIQMGGLLRRSRNRAEMSDVSDTIWDYIYEERRRADDRPDSDKLFVKELNREAKTLKDDDNVSEPTDVSDQEDDSEWSDIFFNGMCGGGDKSNSTFQTVESMCSYYKTRRELLETDRWLALVNRSFFERRNKMQMLIKDTNSSTELFLEPQSSSDQCARCIPIDKRYRRKIVKYAPNDISAARRYHDVDQLGTDYLLPELQIDKYLEELSLNLEEEDPLIRSQLYALHKNGILTFKNLSEQRCRQAQARCKERAKRLAQRVGRPSKHANHRNDIRKKKLKKIRVEREPINLFVPPTNSENVLERKTLEEQLHRLSSGYVYDEIPLPNFRKFSLKDHEDGAVKQLSRKSSNDSLKEICELPTFGLDGISNEALYFAEIHHNIEFPRYSKEEVQRRRRKNLMELPPYVPYEPQRYQHEDPLNVILRMPL
ncbi:hypothetical protein M3Y95_00067200 [Aphelenchoides besseyi]|nr:hypothetical protein M3Y95_00067200 [Aphelenchoides besseyi]